MDAKLIDEMAKLLPTVRSPIDSLLDKIVKVAGAKAIAERDAEDARERASRAQATIDNRDRMIAEQGRSLLNLSEKIVASDKTILEMCEHQKKQETACAEFYEKANALLVFLNHSRAPLSKENRSELSRRTTALAQAATAAYDYCAQIPF